MFENIENVPPHDPDAEQAVLGCMLMDPRALAVGIELLNPEDFYAPENVAAFSAIRALHERGDAVDTVTLRNELVSTNSLDNVGGSEYLAVLTETVPSQASARHYAGIVLDRSLSRSLLSVATAAMRQVWDNARAASVWGDLTEKLSALGMRMVGGTTRPASSIVGEAAAMADPKADESRLIDTGYHHLDALLRGRRLHGGDLIYLAARPSVGKTSFALNVARHNLKAGRPVLILSLEMTDAQLLSNLLVIESGVPNDRLGTQWLGDDEASAYVAAAGRASDWPLWIDTAPSMDMRHVRAVTKRYVEDHGVQLVILDYLQLMRMPRGDREDLRVGEASRQLKALARECDVPIVVLSQLNRTPENRSDPTPRNADLRQSGDLEQDADVILLLYRPCKHFKESPESEAWLLLSKQRNGKLGMVRMDFQGATFTFEEVG